MSAAVVERVLLLEDDEGQRQQRRRLFDTYDIAIEAVGTMDEALALAGPDDFDVVITDINLGLSPHDDSGVLFARRVRELRPDVTIIGYSAKMADLSPQQLEPFTLWLGKGDDSPTDLVSSAIRNVAGGAVPHQAYPMPTLGLMSEPLDQYQGDNAEQFRERAGRIDADLLSLGTPLVLIPESSTGALRTQLFVLASDAHGVVELMLANHPALNGVGDTLDQACHDLLAAMTFFRDDLAVGEVDGDARRLRDFLAGVLNPPS